MPGADFIANLVLNTGVNANWLLTGEGDMFNAESR
ncbi:MAG: helix-turn-helix domain-containing protein [Caldilineaceae bacterium]